MSQSCIKTSVFGNIDTKSLSKTSKQTLEEIKILYGNAKFYYSTNEFSGALVSYSCAAVLLNAMLRELSPANENQVPSVSNTSDVVVENETQVAKVTPSSSQSVSRTPSNTSDVVEPNDMKKTLTETLQCCLTAVEILQKKVGSSRADGEKDEKKDWEKICTKLQPLVFSKGSSNCLFFSGVAGMKREKQLFKTSLVFPLMYPRLYPKASKGILIYGPPGTGKTYIVKAAVNELQKTDPNIGILFFTPSPGDLKGKYVGQTEKKIEEWFTCASKAACDSQLTCGGKKQFISVMFMDEFDAIAPDRNADKTGLAGNSVNTLLQMMDGINSKQNVTVIAATNFPWYLDAAILRRFDTQILVDLPNEGDILELLNLEMKQIIKLRENKPKNAYCESETEKYKKNNEIEIDSKPNVVCEHECVDEPPKDLTVSYPYNQMRYDFYDDMEGEDYRTGKIINITYGNRTIKSLGTKEIISCEIKFDDDATEVIPYKEIINTRNIGPWAAGDKVKVISGGSGGFVDGLVQKLKADNFSNSDITRLLKAANTYTGQICIEGNLFYSTKVFLRNYREEELFISCVTKLRKQRAMIEHSVKLLYWYLNDDTNATITPGIYQLKKPDIVSIKYDDKVYINTKCLLYKHNEFAIEDPSIKEIFIECPEKLATIRPEQIIDGSALLNDLVRLYGEFIVDKDLYNVILVFDFSIKQMETNYVENALYPISRNLIDSVFKPINNEFQNIKKNIMDIEKTEESVSKKGITGKNVATPAATTSAATTPTETTPTETTPTTTPAATTPAATTSAATTSAATTSAATTPAALSRGGAKNLTENIKVQLGLDLTDEDIKTIKNDVMFNIMKSDETLVPVNEFFTEGLKKIVEPDLDALLAPATNNFNVLNNDYSLYKILLLLKAAEDLYNEGQAKKQETKKEETKKEETKKEELKSKQLSILNDSMELYLNSFTPRPFNLVKKDKENINDDENSEASFSTPDGMITLYIENIKTNKKIHTYYDLNNKTIELSMEHFVTFTGIIDDSIITESLLNTITHDENTKGNFETVHNSKTSDSLDESNEFDKILGLFIALSNDYTIHISLDFFVTLYGKYINIQELNKLLCDRISRPQLSEDCSKHQAKPFKNEGNFTDSRQVLMQLYFNDIVDFYQLDHTGNKINTETYLTNFFPKTEDKKNTLLYYSQLICKRILDNYIYVNSNGAKKINSITEAIQADTLNVSEDKKEAASAKTPVEVNETPVEVNETPVEERPVEETPVEVNDTLPEGSTKTSEGGAKKKKRLIRTSGKGKKVQNITARHHLPKKNKSNKRNIRSSKIGDKKYIKIHYDGGASNDYNNQANNGFISFCTDSIPNTFSKKIAEKRIFVKTQYDLNELKIQHKSGFLNFMYYEGGSFSKLIYDHMIKSQEQRNADKKSTQMQMVENLKRKNQFLALIFKRVTAVGFLMTEGQKEVVDDNDILSKTNKPGQEEMSEKKNVVINWIELNEKSSLYKNFQGYIVPLVIGVGKYFEGSNVIEKVKDLRPFFGPETKPLTGPLWLLNTIMDLTLYGVKYVGKRVSNLITNSWATVAMIAYGAYDSYQFYTAENVDNTQITNNFLLSVILNIITENRYITTKKFDDDPASIFSEFLKKKIEQTSGILRKITQTMASSSSLKGETTDYPIVLYNKANIAEPSDIKDKLTNLNIPFRAFAYALTTVKSTYVKETGELLKDYYDNKDKFMEKWKKKQRERGQGQG